MKGIENLLSIMKALRNPESGCPWDLKQDFKSVVAYTLEEAYEVQDAIEREAYGELKGELGDLLFQVVFHARLAEEQGLFDFEAVANAISDKLTRRHPHVFAPETIAKGLSEDEVNQRWEAGKALERDLQAVPGTRPGALAGIPEVLPALKRAQKLGARAARVGFDWQGPDGPRAKIDEELAEVAGEFAAADRAPERLSAECGDVLLSVVSYCRHLGVDAEQALSGANRRFQQRFELMEALCEADDKALEGLEEALLEEYWEKAKAALRTGSSFRD
ncbi:MAG: nucleoside triphosphate pyrophosphohydrolase [Pseudomonadota bacterium]